MKLPPTEVVIVGGGGWSKLPPPGREAVGGGRGGSGGSGGVELLFPALVDKVCSWIGLDRKFTGLLMKGPPVVSPPEAML